MSERAMEPITPVEGLTGTRVAFVGDQGAPGTVNGTQYGFIHVTWDDDTGGLYRPHELVNLGTGKGMTA